MVILCITAALAAPKLTGFREGSKLRNSADDFIATTRYARAHSIETGAVCVIQIDKQSNAYVVKQQNGANFVNIDGEFGQQMNVLDGGTIDGPETITFYPTGRVQPAQVKIAAKDGETLTIGCSTPADDFAVVTQ